MSTEILGRQDKSRLTQYEKQLMTMTKSQVIHTYIHIHTHTHPTYNNAPDKLKEKDGTNCTCDVILQRCKPRRKMTTVTHQKHRGQENKNYKDFVSC